MVDFPLRSVDKEVHQLKLITIITERGGVGGCSRNLCNPLSNLSGMFTGILHPLCAISIRKSVSKKYIRVRKNGHYSISKLVTQLYSLSI